jgi:hypothetical protein
VDTNIKSGDISSAWRRVRALIASCDRRQGGIGQVALGEACGVSQATISRLSSEQPAKWGAGFIRLFNYAQKQERSKTRPDPSTSLVLVSALEEVWNGTDEHAEALAAIIRATGEAARAANQ